MITDEQMINLGFEKFKTYKKKEIGVSLFYWTLKGLDLELHKIEDDGGFYPTLNLPGRITHFTEIEEVELLLKALRI